MSTVSALRQRVVVVDPLPRSREYMRRAIRGLGHAPLIFTSSHELLAANRPIQRCALMCFSIPPGGQDLRRVVDACRAVVGKDVPVMFVAAGHDPKALKDLGRIQQNELLATPSSFADVYNSLEGFMIRNGLPLAEIGLAWGPYRFFSSMRAGQGVRQRSLAEPAGVRARAGVLPQHRSATVVGMAQEHGAKAFGAWLGEVA